jgi:AraC-like DNA-binding protein
VISQQAFAKIARHRMRVCSRVRESRGYLRHLALPNVSLCNLGFGSEAIVEGEAQQDYYYLQHVFSGIMTIESGSTYLSHEANTIATISPFHRVTIHHSENCTKLIVRMRRDFLERELATMLGFPLKERIEFAPVASVDEPAMGTLVRAIEHVCREVDDPYSSYRTAHCRGQLEHLLASSMLFGMPNSYSNELRRLGDDARPGYLRRAERYIQCHVGDDISLDDLVNVSGASLRTLYKVFSDHWNVTPIGYVKRVRLETARRELEDPCSRYHTVAGVASAVGMSHLGNFSADYKRFYGELPSETLKKSR